MAFGIEYKLFIASMSSKLCEYSRDPSYKCLLKAFVHKNIASIRFELGRPPKKWGYQTGSTAFMNMSNTSFICGPV